MKILALSLIFTCAIAGPAQALKVVLPPDFDNTDLHKAAEACNVEKARAVLNAMPATKTAKEINRLDREGYTPLAYAAQNGCTEVVKLLVESGAVVDATDNYTRWTPLLRAANDHRIDAVRYLLAHRADVNAKAGNGQTPLTEAIYGNFFSRDVSKEDRDGTIRALLAAGADVNLPGRFGRTPLMTAVIQGDANLVRLLIGKDAKLSPKDEQGKTALDYAEERNEREIWDVLKKIAAELKVGRVHAILEQWHGSSYRGGEFSVTVLYGDKRWQQFWQEYLERKEPGGFDESRHQAVYIELGTRPTGGYVVEVVSAYEEDNRLVLEYIEHEPAPDQYVIQTLTTPWVMVLLPRTDLRVVTRKARVKRAE